MQYQSCILKNGEELNIYLLDAHNSPMLKKIYINTDLIIISKINNTMVGFLTISSGQQMKSMYAGELDITVDNNNLGKGIEQMLLQRLYQWLRNKDSFKKANFKIRINNFLKLEFLINLCVNQKQNKEVFNLNEFIGIGVI